MPRIPASSSPRPSAFVSTTNYWLFEQPARLDEGQMRSVEILPLILVPSMYYTVLRFKGFEYAKDDEFAILNSLPEQSLQSDDLTRNSLLPVSHTTHKAC